MKPQIDLALILGLSILLYVLSTYGTRYYRHSPNTSIFLWLKEKVPCQLRSWAYHSIRLIYYIGLPYLALRQGIVLASTMGLGNPITTTEDILTAIGLALAIFAILSMTWWSYSRSLSEITEPSTIKANHSVVAKTLDVVYQEVHWAFYRSGPIFWLAGDYYAGSVLGFLLIGLEEILNPMTRDDLRRPQTNMAVLIRWGIMLCMTTIFFFTRSLWLVTGLHWLVAMGSSYVQRPSQNQSALADDFPS